MSEEQQMRSVSQKLRQQFYKQICCRNLFSCFIVSKYDICHVSLETDLKKNVEDLAYFG